MIYFLYLETMVILSCNHEMKNSKPHLRPADWKDGFAHLPQGLGAQSSPPRLHIPVNLNKELGMPFFSIRVPSFITVALSGWSTPLSFSMSLRK